MAKAAEGFWRPPAATRRDLRHYGLMMAAVLSAATGLLWYRQVAWTWTAGAAILFAVLATVWPTPLRPLYSGWMMAARILGFVNSHLLLALVFYLVFTPMGLVLRLVRQDPLRRAGFQPTAAGCRPGGTAEIPPAANESLWIRRDPEVLPGDHFKRQF